MTLTEVIEKASERQKKYRRTTAVVSFTTEAENVRYKIYFYSQMGQALKDCKVGERVYMEGRVVKGFGWWPQK